MTKENNDRCPNCGCLRIEEPTEAATADERTDWKQWGMDMRLFVDTLENSTARNQILALLSLAPDGDDKVGSESARRTLQSIADGLAHAAGEEVVFPEPLPCSDCTIDEICPAHSPDVTEPLCGLFVDIDCVLRCTQPANTIHHCSNTQPAAKASASK